MMSVTCSTRDHDPGSTIETETDTGVLLPGLVHGSSAVPLLPAQHQLGHSPPLTSATYHHHLSSQPGVPGHHWTPITHSSRHPEPGHTPPAFVRSPEEYSSKNFIYDFKIVRREVLMIHSRTLTWYLTVPPDCLVDQIVGDLPVTWCSCQHSPGCQTFWSWPSSRPWCSTARCWSCTGDTSQALSGTEAAQWRVRHWCSHTLECRRSKPEINKLSNFDF